MAINQRIHQHNTAAHRQDEKQDYKQANRICLVPHSNTKRYIFTYIRIQLFHMNMIYLSTLYDISYI
jgi:hypothetical protein